MKIVRKALIPAAGLGTRFLPATKTVPKEMLTVVDQPILLYVIEEAVRAGAEDIVLIAGRGKHAIEDFFDRSYEVEDLLYKSGKTDLLNRLISIREMANIISVRQKEALGLGHAVLCGEPVIGNEPFAVLLGDEIMHTLAHQPTVTAQLAAAYSETGLSTVAIMNVAKNEVEKYGIIAGTPLPNGRFSVSSVVEKPKASEAPSSWALPGRYVFTGDLWTYLKEIRPGKNNEIQLTDAMTALAKNKGLVAMPFEGTRFDAGDKLGYIQANIELALLREDLAPALKEYLKKKVEGWPK